MIPVFYYICCYGAGQKYLGKFYLFSLMTGDLENKIWLGTAGILLTAAGIVIRNRKK
ncbi:LPXTG cell wall anchor domain-containing protein [Blautia sp. RD014234]|nr:LPXTG cell wall anchor domain-containing protein [Blautia parvula]